MTQKSFVWAGITLGDADQAPYSDDEWADIWNILFIRDNTDQGYIEGYLNELAVTNPSGSTIRVATGAALVDGTFYDNDANVDNTISTPAVSTRIDRYVLRKSWAAQTVRVAIVAGVEGGGAPALTQTDGVTWEIPLAQASITTGGVITLTDERVICRSPLGFTTEGSQVVIETQEGDGASATLDFQNIPSTYQHLMIIGQGRTSTAVLAEIVEMRFNADAGANYNFQVLTGQNASAAAAASATQNEFAVAQVPGSTATADFAGNFIIWIPNYKRTVLNKGFESKWGTIPNTTVANFKTSINSGIWDDTSAITRVQLILTGNWVTGSNVTLYGVK